jgi:ubiquinone/menaquinone biosynthesis C-methylase UbiE
MESIDYRRMFDLETHHWWFQAKIDLMRRLVARHCPDGLGPRKRLLDIGCGTGLFLSEESRATIAYGIDFSEEALRLARSRGNSNLICADSQTMPVASDSFDVVTALDVLEHVDHDGAVIAETHRVLQPGGIALIGVPAHPFLRGAHDDALHHKRRYRWDEFDRLFDPKMWIRRRMTWTFASIYPIAGLVRSLRNFVPAKNPIADTSLTPASLNRLLLQWHRLENSWVETRNLPFGLSLLTVREKIP